MKTKINSLEQALALIDRFENGKDVRLVPGLTSNGLGIKVCYGDPSRRLSEGEKDLLKANKWWLLLALWARQADAANDQR
ncbi:hypothetical protein [Tepidiphilus thermophilus]|uniref:Uncharacterized protein n=1 Tax=Tepidiphilus thermophilus TaxID=876478 RepID=A0A0K6IY44_9PROT|nr:hypothetical protein [Tepidiphilus thermophilus]CUB08041.1 hypothetical protein Ga0061068_11819 [Tepidiphilus thermophilus]